MQFLCFKRQTAKPFHMNKFLYIFFENPSIQTCLNGWLYLVFVRTFHRHGDEAATDFASASHGMVQGGRVAVLTYVSAMPSAGSRGTYGVGVAAPCDRAMLMLPSPLISQASMIRRCIQSKLAAVPAGEGRMVRVPCSFAESLGLY